MLIINPATLRHLHETVHRLARGLWFAYSGGARSKTAPPSTPTTQTHGWSAARLLLGGQLDHVTNLDGAEALHALRTIDDCPGGTKVRAFLRWSARFCERRRPWKVRVPRADGGMSGYPVAAVRRAFVVSYSCLDLTDSSTSSAATTWSSFIAASQRRPCEELKQPPSSKTSSRKTRKSSWRGSRATTGEGTSDRPATTPETAAAERPAIDTTACTRPRRGISVRCGRLRVQGEPWCAVHDDIDAQS